MATNGPQRIRLDEYDQPESWGGVGGGLTSDQVVDLLYPVGAIYVSTLSTNPNTILGRGTWSAFGAGRVMVGRDSGDADFDTGEETGGAKTVAAAGTNSAPTFTGSALGTHLHGAGTYAPSAHSGTAVANHNVTQPSDHAALTHSGASVDDHASHTHNYTQVVNHVHVQTVNSSATGALSGYTADTSTNTAVASGYSTQNPTGGVATGTTAGPSATMTHTVNQASNHAAQSHSGAAVDAHAVTQPSAHTMNGSSEAVSAGTPAGTVSAPTFTGSATSVVQPYIVVYMWKRTA